jgi:transcriptional pleiotropic regulator of transition state genes
MKSTGIMRRVDKLGRIVIPKELREANNIFDNDPLEIFTDEDKIILVKINLPAGGSCAICGNTKQLYDFADKKICTRCIREFKKMRL